MHIICYGYTLCCSFSFTSKICNEDIFENEKVSSYFLRECSERVTWRRGEKGQRTHGKVRCKAILKENGSTMKIDWSSHKICWRMLQSSFMFLKEEKVQVLWSCLFLVQAYWLMVWVSVPLLNPFLSCFFCLFTCCGGFYATPRSETTGLILKDVWENYMHIEQKKNSWDFLHSEFRVGSS